ncbi:MULTISPECIES: hypothetical protein [Acidobacterium]|uniref:Uncharacterized protein n=1 Tax=Acidobacterium capsulatum (strain ATCC 51196 / DSM 11244 / BCRC 80197 / JCM 7670 / NBRC 15755 / NCIMB 13165 / 161) TaxID=240015 RepID=C1FA09_ACIC5|nr:MULTISPECIES: hypothetical protein [Acidobacterium]ACO32903.1 hypothetical protein ACP_0388 [Acidobacterium capsulatum ATCC 51196]
MSAPRKKKRPSVVSVLAECGWSEKSLLQYQILRVKVDLIRANKRLRRLEKQLNDLESANTPQSGASA